MRNQFFALFIVGLSCTPLYSMEQKSSASVVPKHIIMPIRGYQYSKESIANINSRVDFYVTIAKESNITSGLATSMNKIKNEGIEQLIKNEDVLNSANQMLEKIKTDPIFNNLEAMNTSLLQYRQVLGENIKKIINHTSYIYIQCICFSILKSSYDVKLPKDNLLDLCTSTEDASVFSAKEFLTLNKDFDSEKNTKHIEAILLLSEYLYGKQIKEAGSTINRDGD